MDKNIAALLRKDTYTVGVRFLQRNLEENFKGSLNLGAAAKVSDKEYTYISDIATLVEGDTVIVQAIGNLSLAIVSRVDEDVCINPNEEIKYKWVVQKVDMSDYIANLKKNKEIEDMISESYRQNVRRQFADQLLNGLAEEDKVKLLTNLGG